MFSADTYRQRRERLAGRIEKGLILLPGNGEASMNYAANVYAFRQDGTFLYFAGLDEPALALVVDADEGMSTLFGDEPSAEDRVWTGPLPPLHDRAAAAGIPRTAPTSELAALLSAAASAGRSVHFLPPYRAETLLAVASLLGIPVGDVRGRASADLIRAVVEQRSIKTAEEVREIEAAVDVTLRMHLAAMESARPGMTEAELAGISEGAALAAGSRTSFPMIMTVHGEILHNPHHANVIEKDRLVVHDSGAESPLHYAADITRTFPAAGRFSPPQRDIYTVVLRAQEAAVAAIRPGVPFRDVHLLAARTIAAGLGELGLMRGDVDEAVAAGAHALFFPHGLGHMLGLDTHDMENLGEDNVGYDAAVRRSSQFGLSYLRLARKLEPGFVLTVEPGVYFIPDLIDRWKADATLAAFVDFETVGAFRDFGGVRLEDDVLVTADGCRVLGPPIPRTIEEVEAVTTISG